LKFLVNIDKGQKRSEQLEKNLVKLTIKSFALIGTRQIKPEEFAATDKLMKNVFEFLVKVYFFFWLKFFIFPNISVEDMIVL
jgi:hypothetical protein